MEPYYYAKLKELIWSKVNTFVPLKVDNATGSKYLDTEGEKLICFAGMLYRFECANYKLKEVV